MYNLFIVVPVCWYASSSRQKWRGDNKLLLEVHTEGRPARAQRQVCIEERIEMEFRCGELEKLAEWHVSQDPPISRHRWQLLLCISINYSNANMKQLHQLVVVAVKGEAEFWIIFKENWNETLFHFCFTFFVQCLLYQIVNVSTHCAFVYMKVWLTAFPPTQTNKPMWWSACTMLFNHAKQWYFRQMLSSSRCFSGAPPPRHGSVCVLFMTMSM